ncbi:MAG: hypothetical protein KAS23_00050 [Anaerohalosphaera sp.]|nr:hypothetical protein [Anaerohalosphaera sp.]
MVKSEKRKRLISLCLGILSLMLGVPPYLICVLHWELLFPEYDNFLVLFWFAAIATGLLATKTARAVKFKPGIILGRIGFGISTFLFLLMLLLFAETISDGRMTCSREMQDLSSVTQQYSEHNEGTLPDADTWCDQLLESAGDLEIFERFEAWISSSDSNVSYSHEIITRYAININLDSYRLADIDRQTVLMFETDIGWNQNGTSDILVPEGHPGFWPFFEGGYHFIFVGPDSTFTVKFIKNSELDSLNWMPAE